MGSKTANKHIAEIDRLFTSVFSAGMRVKFLKCGFGRREVEALGHKVAHHSIMSSNSHVDAIAFLQEPTNFDSLTRFIGIVNYFAARAPSRGTWRMSPSSSCPSMTSFSEHSGTSENQNGSPS